MLHLVHNGYSIERVLTEIAKCNVRCRNCHARVTYERRGRDWRADFMAASALNPARQIYRLNGQSYIGGMMAVTSVDIDTEVLRLAKSSLGVRTNREAIDLALRDVVRRRRQLEAVDALATIRVDRDATTIAYGD